jgi:uncharacterized protein (TIGR03000 family)
MYSVILATMLTAGSTAPAGGHGCHGCHGGGHGCHGCHGGCYGGCGGGCYGGGCYGRGCYGGGCYGGGCYGGGCYGGGYGSGWGTGYGGYGHYAYYGCSGGYNVFGCGGGYGGASAPAGFALERGYGTGPMVAPAAAPVAPPPAPAPAARSFFVEPIAPVAANVREENPAPTSRITVRLPENARLYVNEDPCPLKTDTRSFDTPQLKAEKEYSYTLRAEIERNGQTVSEVKKVVFRAGAPVNVEFKEIGTVRTVQR